MSSRFCMVKAGWLELDTEERHAELPDELRQAFASQPQAAAAFEKMAYSHQKEWISWIVSAKQAATRMRRVEKALAVIAQGKNLRDVSGR